MKFSLVFFLNCAIRYRIQDLPWNIELPFLKILFNNDLFSAIEVQKLDIFLQDIWLSPEDLETYKQLQKIDLTSIDREKVRIYEAKIMELFATKKLFIISIINKTDVFIELFKQLNFKLSVDKNRILEIIYEYIRFWLLGLVTNYETQRVSKWIFDIVKK